MMRNLAALAILVIGLKFAVEGHGGVALAALVIAFLVAKSGGSSPKLAGRVVTGHSHGSTRKFIAKHEGGHAVAAKAVGGRVKSAWMTDSEGLVSASIPDDPVKVVAFLAAGRAAVNSGWGCSADDAAIRKELRRVPSKDRGQVKRDGMRLARRITSSQSGDVRRFAKRLDEEGRL